MLSGKKEHSLDKPLKSSNTVTLWSCGAFGGGMGMCWLQEKVNDAKI